MMMIIQRTFIMRMGTCTIREARGRFAASLALRRLARSVLLSAIGPLVQRREHQ